MTHLIIPEIIDTTIAARTKVTKLFIGIAGIAKPATVAPLKSNPVIIIFGTNFVNKYRIKALVKVENSPKVIRLNGNVKTLNMGFKIRNINVKVMLPNANVNNPPFIVTPGSINGRTNNEIL